MIYSLNSVTVRGVFAIGFCVLAVSMSACTSMSKRAKESLEAGDHEKAAELYEKVVARDPGDKEAVSGLKQARAGVIEQRLLFVRKARQTNRMSGRSTSCLS
jgi:alkyl sulfatase BDS1-like metallo-beta-lactamase superfamily hydrolase